jgi:hypothetical protein
MRKYYLGLPLGLSGTIGESLNELLSAFSELAPQSQQMSVLD